MLTITQRDAGGVVVFDLVGQIDGGPESEKIQEMIKDHLEKGNKKFLLNLAEVKWLNSLGAGIMIASYVSAKRDEAVVKVCTVSDRVGLVLKTSGLIPEVFDTFETENEALASCE